MKYSDYRISLDVRNIGSPIALECKKGETKIRIYITLLEGIKPYAISDECTAVFTAKKPDGNILFNNCGREDNFIVYEFTPQTTSAVGVLNCEIRLYGADSDLLISASFRLLVHDAVYNDGDEIESTSEVTTLTSLISEATTLISTVNDKLENGDFVPKMEIGEVKTLPAGSNATASFSGTGEAPILNLGIPMGEQGQAEGLIPDTELSLDSTKPVQNKVITAALNEKADTNTVNQVLNQKADAETVNQALNLKADVETVNQALKQKADAEAVNLALGQVNTALDNKVDKVSGKGLSTNDFTTAEKQKLAGIEAGANKFVLNKGDVSQTYTATIPASGWVQYVNYATVAQTIPGLIADDAPIVDLDLTGKSGATLMALVEAWANIIRCGVSSAGEFFLYSTEIPAVDLPVKVMVIRK